MVKLISMLGRDSSKRNLVWCVPKPSQLDKPPLIFGEISTCYRMFFLFWAYLPCTPVNIIISINEKAKKKVGGSPAVSIKKGSNH
jgi:hypothetical protein